MKRIMLLWLILGAVYLTIEILWRGKTHVSMLIVGGLCGILIGAINQIPFFYKSPIIIQAVIGAFIVLIIEFSSGCIINLWLGLDVWDYTGQFGNIMGQVCVQYGVLWLFLMPFAIWLEDTARWLMFSWDTLMSRSSVRKPDIPPYTVFNIYKEFFTFK